MDLDVHQLELRRHQIDDELAANAREWHAQVTEIERVARRSGGKTEGLPRKPTSILDDLKRGHILLLDKSEWLALSEILRVLRGRIAELATAPIPQVSIVAESLNQELQQLNDQLSTINAERVSLYATKQLKDADITSLQRRIKTLSEDLQKNQDVQKLQRYSGATASLTPDHCPTCEQSLIDTLLTQETLTAVMPIEDNIEYLRSQLRMFENILSREEEAISSLSLSIISTDKQLAKSTRESAPYGRIWYHRMLRRLPRLWRTGYAYRTAYAKSKRPSPLLKRPLNN